MGRLFEQFYQLSLPQLQTPLLMIHFTKGLDVDISKEEEQRNRKRGKFSTSTLQFSLSTIRPTSCSRKM